MRTNIDVDDATLAAAIRAGPYKTKKDAVDAGLKLLARQAAYREILKWEGKLHWDGDEDPAADMRPARATPVDRSLRSAAPAATQRVVASEPTLAYRVAKASRGRR